MPGYNRRHAVRQRCPGDNRAGLGSGRAEVAVGEVGADEGDPLLGDAANLGRPPGDGDVGDGIQRHGSLGVRIDDQAPDFVDTRLPRIDAADHDVDLLVTPRITGCEFAPDVSNDAIGDVAHGEPELGGAFLIEHDLDFGIAPLHRRADVGETIGEGHLLYDCIADRLEILEVES